MTVNLTQKATVKLPPVKRRLGLSGAASLCPKAVTMLAPVPILPGTWVTEL